MDALEEGGAGAATWGFPGRTHFPPDCRDPRFFPEPENLPEPPTNPQPRNTSTNQCKRNAEGRKRPTNPCKQNAEVPVQASQRNSPLTEGVHFPSMKPTNLQISGSQSLNGPNGLASLRSTPRSIFRSPRIDQPPSIVSRELRFSEAHAAPVLDRPEALAEAMMVSLQEAGVDPEETLPYRLWAAWRITCELGRHLAISHKPSVPCLDPEESALWMLEDEEVPLAALQARISPWLLPRQGVALDASTARFRAKGASVRRPVWPTIARLADMAGNPEVVPIERRGWSLFNGKVQYWAGIALQPPAVPREFAIVSPEGEIDLHPRIIESDGYDPYRDDPNLLIWMEAAKFVWEQLKIENGTELEPRAGIRARGLLASPLTVRMLWPAPTDLIEFEEAMVSEVTGMMQDMGNHNTQRDITRMWGLQSWESARLIGLANQKLAQRSSEDVDVSKGRIISRLEKVADRASNALDTRGELMALKALAVVQGVARMDPEDETSSFKNIIKASGPPPKSPQDMPALPEA